MGVLHGKTAIITGATSGIGARTAELFVAEGAHVLIAGRRSELGLALAARLGPAAEFVRTDVASEGDIEALVGHAAARYGRLDCMFNNAGGPTPRGRIADLDIAEYDAAMAVLLRGVVLGMKYAARVMVPQGSGSIINMASVGGLRAGYAAHTYSAAKAAVIHMTRCVAVELGENGLRVNSISPGAIVTGIFGKVFGLTSDVADREAGVLETSFAKRQPIPRAGMPNDIAQAALYLASDASSFVNGHDLVVDGGLIAGRSFSTQLASAAEMGQVLSGQRSAS